MKFLKTLTTLSLIFALFTLHIEGRAIAFSTSFSAQPANQDVAPEGEFVETVATPNATDSVGNSSKNALDYRESRQEPGKLTINQIMVLVLLLTGPTVGIVCISQTSGKLFAAGAAIYLIMEIMNYKSYKEAVQSHKEMYAELTDDAAVNTEQVDAFMAAESMELAAADAIKKRKSNTSTLAIAVTVAAAASIVEAILGTTTYTTCMTASYGTACTACEQADIAIQSCRVPCSAMVSCAPAAALAAGCLASSAPVKRIDPLNEYGPQLYASNESSQNELSIVSSFMKETEGEYDRYNLEKVTNNKDQVKQMIELMVNQFISTASAGDDKGVAAKGGVLGGFGITLAALGAALAIFLPAQVTFLNKLGNGYIRAAYFGVLATFAWLAVAELGKAEDKLRENAGIYKSLYERLLAAMNSSSRFANMDGVNSGIRDRISGYQGVRDQMNNPPNGALCLVGNLGEQTVDENCSCRQNNTCSKVDFSGVDFSGQGLPGFFGQTTSGLQAGANSAFSGNLAGANGAFAGIGSNAANLRKLNDRLKAKAAAQLDALNKGKSKTDFKKLEDGLTKQLEKIAPSIIKSASAKNGSTLAALGVGTTGIGSGFGGKPEDLKPKDMLASVNQAVAATPKSTGAADPLAGFKFDFPQNGSADSADGGIGAEGALSQGDALNEFENNESDINDRKSENIFKIITFRYFKSAYPRFFDEDKKEEVKPTLE